MTASADVYLHFIESYEGTRGVLEQHPTPWSIELDLSLIIARFSWSMDGKHKLRVVGKFPISDRDDISPGYSKIDIPLLKFLDDV